MNNSVDNSLRLIEKAIFSNETIHYYIPKELEPEISDIFEIREYNKYSVLWTKIICRNKQIEDMVFKAISRKEVFASFQEAITTYLLIHQIEFSYEIRDVLLKHFFSICDQVFLDECFKKILDTLNTERWFSQTDLIRNPENFDGYNKLINQLEYAYELYDSPINSLYSLVQYSNTVYFYKLLICASSVLYCILLSIGLIYDIFWEKCRDLYSAISEYRIPLTRIAVLLYRIGDQEIKLTNKVELKKILDEFWEPIGKYIFRRSYTQWVKRPVEYHFKEYEETCAAFLKERIIANKYDFILSFKWPEDFIALSGYLLSTKDTSNNLIELNDKLSQALADQLFLYWKDIDIIQITANRAPPGDIYDVLEPQNNLCITIISHAIFHENNIDRWFKLFRNHIYILKPLFYSSYAPMMKAREYAAFIISLFLLVIRSSDLSEQVAQRARQFLALVSKEILYPFISSCELLEDIWNVDRIKTTDRWMFGIENIYKLNLLLGEITKENNAAYILAFGDFLVQFRKLANTQWPWMKESWS